MDVDQKKEAKNKLNDMQTYLKIHQDNEETTSDQEDVFDEHRIVPIIDKPQNKQKKGEPTITYFSPRRQQKGVKNLPSSTFGASPRLFPKTALLPPKARLLSPPSLISPKNKKRFEHVKPKFYETQKYADGLLVEKLELHAIYAAKKKLE